MVRFLTSILIGLVAGVLLGLLIGYVIAPFEYIDSPMRDLDQTYKDEYTVMVATGYVVDRDVQGALERLSKLGVGNVPQHVQDITERYITDSRSLDQIRYLVALAEGMGRLQPIMEPYRELNAGGN